MIKQETTEVEAKVFITKSKSGHYTATVIDRMRRRVSRGKLASLTHARDVIPGLLREL